MMGEVGVHNDHKVASYKIETVNVGGPARHSTFEINE